MPQPALSPHLRRLLTDEHVRIVSLWQTATGRFFCCLMAPEVPKYSVLQEGALYAMEEDIDAEGAVMAARKTLWNGL